MPYIAQRVQNKSNKPLKISDRFKSQIFADLPATDYHSSLKEGNFSRSHPQQGGITTRGCKQDKRRRRKLSHFGSHLRHASNSTANDLVPCPRKRRGKKNHS
ncbi:hypothetical protein AVEN_97071-1 [Araneus ventricosus]|uniref:Uncharacterized protein n=1 Tax=Araneus ventricosus TaxID=182803 RepID=A0A4Y2EI76_ARAVE|nr:hypothetical protein AVEN_97071-1 [Araneus ventricosus]